MAKPHIRNDKYETTGEIRETPSGVTVWRIRARKSFGWVKKGELGGFIENEENLSTQDKAWVRNNACVFGRALIFGDALVSDRATVYDRALVCDQAQVTGLSSVFEDAKVSGEACISGAAKVSGCAVVAGNALIKGYASVCVNSVIKDEAVVYDNATIVSASVSGRAHVRGGSYVQGVTVSGQTCIGYAALVTQPNHFITISPIGSEAGCLTAYLQSDGTIIYERGCFTGTKSEFLAAVKKKHSNTQIQKQYKLCVSLVETRLLHK